ncbi:MAG: NAD(+)/NADH kinase [Candidatus Thermoplasmatota archaeon]|nr:NAD(+)/NADH kinase [Candidatus Thermoplasmatota archaeon]
MKLGLVAHPKKKEAIMVAGEVVELVHKMEQDGKDISLVIEKELRDVLGEVRSPGASVEKMAPRIIICIGGDGTLLKTLQRTALPVLGVNVGSLGFLMEIMPKNLKETLEELVAGNYTIEERTRLKTLLNGERLPDATNEAVIATSTPSKIQEFEFYIDMGWAQVLRADGIIISTPTGSTSYALSAGGSVLDPRLNALEIVPIAPFRINSRPIIIPDQSTISLKVTHRARTAQLVIDGTFRKTIRNRDQLLFTRSKEKTRFVRFDTNFYRKFQEKILKERPPLNMKGKY